ncbi:MAG: hypothetical protein OHK0045_22360 [Raineya sp.]
MEKLECFFAENRKQNIQGVVRRVQCYFFSKNMTEKLREAFLEASQSYTALKKFEQILTENPNSSALGTAYKAALRALYGYYAIVPAIKLSYFFEASQLLQSALEQSPDNIEVRFIRFAIESNLPAAANNYALHLREDKKVIIDGIGRSKLKKSFKKVIAQMLIASMLCTFSDKRVLEKYLAD